MIDKLIKFAKQYHPGFEDMPESIMHRMFEVYRDTILVYETGDEIKGFAIYQDWPDRYHFIAIAGTGPWYETVQALLAGREKFAEVAPLISSRGTRFRVESLGYAAHMGTLARLEPVLEMRGPVAQIVYLRDLTKLGTSFPIQWAEGDEELVGYND